MSSDYDTIRKCIKHALTSWRVDAASVSTARNQNRLTRSSCVAEKPCPAECCFRDVPLDIEKKTKVALW